MANYRFWDASDFWINDIPLNHIDENGCKWLVQDVDGWWELPPPAIPDDTRPYTDDGDYYVSGRYGTRSIVIKGRILPPNTSSTVTVTDARDRLNATLNAVRKTIIFKVDEPRYAKQASVQIDAKPTMEINTHKNHVEFSIQFKASDPRKYYAEVQNVAATLAGNATSGRKYPKTFYFNYGAPPSDGKIYAENYGDYHTFGTVRISGPITNPRLRHAESNRSLNFNIVLATDQFLDVNLRAKTVKLNGKQFKRSALTTDSQWFRLEPGMNTVQLTGTQHIPAVEGKEAATNLVYNPNFEYSVTDTNNIVNTNYAITPSAGSSSQPMTITSDRTISPVTFATDGPVGTASYCNKITVTNSDMSLTKIAVSQPLTLESIPQTYVMSEYIRSDVDLDVYAYVAQDNNSQSPFKGVTTRLKAGTWTRLSVPFTTNSSNPVTPGFYIIEGQTALKSVQLSVTALMIEKGTIPSKYFDGGSSAGIFKYRWEGTSYKSRAIAYADSYVIKPPMPPSGNEIDEVATNLSSSTAFNVSQWKQLRNTVDTTDNAGNVVAVKSNTPTDTDNISFLIPSTQPSAFMTPTTLKTVSGTYLFPGQKYVAMVDAIVTDSFVGSYTTTEMLNYAVNPTPRLNFSNSWSQIGFSDPLTLEDSVDLNQRFVRVNVSNDVTKVNGSGISYKQPRGRMDSGAEYVISFRVRTNRAVPIQPVVRWYKGNTLMRESYGSAQIPTVAGDWQSLVVEGTAPLDYDRITVSASVTNINEVSTWLRYDYFDMKNILIRKADELTDFFDGDTTDTDSTNYTWTGEVGNSESKRIDKSGGLESLHPLSRSLALFTAKNGSVSSLDADNIDMSNVVMSQAPNTPGEYQLRIEFTVPEGTQTSNMYIGLWNGSPNSSDIIYFDKFLIVETQDSYYSGKYFDGSSPNSSWSGTANQSASRQQAVTEVPVAQALLQYRSAWIH